MTNPASYRYSALPTRPGGTWPNGARLAIVVCVGVESYRFGDGRTEDVLADVPTPDLVNTAWRDYGNRVGAFRLFELLRRLGIPPTVLLNTDVYDEAPAVMEAARATSAEIVGHGRSNSDTLSGMTPEAERAYLADVADRIRHQEGSSPGGWSSPWLSHTPDTLNLLVATGYRYLLDLRLDDQPVWLSTESGPLLAIPYAAELNDSSTMVGRSVSARDFADMIVDEFTELHTAAEHTPLVMSVVLHSFISGVPFRLRAIGQALERIAASEGVWLTTPREIHRAVVESPESFR
ncbi:polysaccharide deacetylase family protein [Mycolicibacterium hodleri]|uniref:Polysaccharide deacetylase n=1 Tax=Mycolicibacterium hodleri TaxID=49897 RepID=A0A502EKX5_9MYCO|nr:polysaccharide deacetylase family protein [Mycolicibacterium hodleri]TPG37136.1 polysaccharide deacetylase [Mycolicibacterium hodleri]